MALPPVLLAKARWELRPALTQLYRSIPLLSGYVVSEKMGCRVQTVFVPGIEMTREIYNSHSNPEISGVCPPPYWAGARTGHMGIQDLYDFPGYWLSTPSGISGEACGSSMGQPRTPILIQPKWDIILPNQGADRYQERNRGWLHARLAPVAHELSRTVFSLSIS